jgi:hypothetical protein
MVLANESPVGKLRHHKDKVVGGCGRQPAVRKLVFVRPSKVSNKTIRQHNTLKFNGMDPLVTIVHLSLVVFRSSNWANSAFNKSKAVFQWGTLVMYCISTILERLC